MDNRNTNTTGSQYNQKTLSSNFSKNYRNSSEMSWIKSFNNWIKAVLINKYCSIRTNEVRKSLDLPPSNHQKTLHVLDIGCGHGQDIGKWNKNSVGYIVGIDVSDKAIEQYLKRWNGSDRNNYDFTPIHMSASKPELYEKISHSYYDIVSAQLSLHYMFGSEQEVRKMLSNALENLLEGGYMILTIPDSCSIVKKMRTYSEKNGEYYVHGNQYYSIRFKSLDFNKENGSFGLQYGFYLKEAIGKEDTETGDKQYWNEYLIELDAFERILKEYGMQVIENKNFLEFYKDNLNEHRQLFGKMGLIFDKGQAMHEDFWEIAHLYRVFTARKTVGKNYYPLINRNQDRKKVSQRQMITHNNNHRDFRGGDRNQDRRHGGNSYSNNSRGNSYSNNHYSNNNHSNNRGGRGGNYGGNHHSQSRRNNY